MCVNANMYMCTSSIYSYTVSQKQALILLSISLPDIDLFLKFFHWLLSPKVGNVVQEEHPQFLDPGRVPKNYEIVVGVGVVVTVFEKCLRLS